jgi:hypothetical protein
MTKQVRFVIGGAAVVAALLLVSSQVVSQEKPAQQTPGGEQWAEMMAKWAELNAKGPEHEQFKDAVGAWKAVMKQWMAPGSPPMVSEGAAEFRLLLDGRYVQQTYTCEAQQFEGIGIEGYDRIKKKYVSIWMDNMSTGIMAMEGTADSSGKVITYFGKVDDPMTGERDKVVRSVARTIGDDKVVFEMYDRRPDVGEFKAMEITYTREK